MEVRAGYKQTDLGLIPNNWEVKPLGECASFRTGPFGSALHKSDYVDDGIPVVNPMHINDGRIESTRGMTITASAAKALADFRMKAGEVVIGRRGDMGRCAVVEPEHEGWLCGTGSMIVRGRATDEHFLQRVLSSPRAIASIEEASVGSTMVNLNQGTLARLKVQFPPLSEQRAIAGALRDIDALLAGLDRLTAKKRDLKQAAMQQLLTGQTRLPGFQGEWEVKTLHEVCQKIQDGTHFSPKLGGNEYLYVTSKNIRFGTLDMSTAERISATEHVKIFARCDVKKGDLLLTKDGANTGNAALNPLDEPFSLLSSVAMLRFDSRKDAATYFMHQILSGMGQMQIKEAMSGNAITRLTLQKIRALRFPVARLDEQMAIAEALDAMDAELASLAERRKKTHALKQGMMQELLTGRTRLV